MPSSNTNQAGFTLIEVLVAVILITLVIAPLDGLLIRAERLSETARQRFVATSLAEEGLELVRITRDNNWFAFSEPERWLDQGLCFEGDRSYEDKNRQITLDPDLVTEGVVGDFELSQLYLQSNGAWTHNATDQDTGFSRILTLDCSTKFSEQPYITVTSTVSWDQRGQQEQVVIKEKLYNWYPSTRLSAQIP